VADDVSLTVDPQRAAEIAAQAVRERLGTQKVDLAFVLGSGWSAATDAMGETIRECPLTELPGFSKPVVTGHGGMLRLVRTPSDKLALIFTGRTHFYEGRGVEAVVHGVRTAATLGARTLVLTNGCGGLEQDWPPGTPVLIKDHINLTGQTPLRGATFVDLTEAYSARLRALARQVFPELPEGVYVQFRGPQFETPAEVRMAGILGGQLVGMSTTLETIAAREAGMEVLGISLVTNYGAGMADEGLSHAEVLQAGTDAGPRLREVLAGLAGIL
jgi:purine-nucleoside phosphorylase